MDKLTLLKKLEAILDEARRTNQWGSVELILQCGEVAVIRETRTTKLFREGTTHDPRTEAR